MILERLLIRKVGDPRSPPRTTQTLMSTNKRKAAADDNLNNNSPPKRAKQSDMVIVDEDDDGVAAIWAQIQAQERAAVKSQAVADRSSFHKGLASNRTSDYNDSDDVFEIWAQIQAQEQARAAVESDEQLARRLASEWQTEESNETHEPMIIDKSRSQTSSRDANPPVQVGDVDPLQTFAEYIPLFTQQRACRACQGSVPARRGFVSYSYPKLFAEPDFACQVMLGSTSPPLSLLYILHVQCDACKASFCRGCFKPLTCKPNCRGKSPCDVLSCCAEVRAIALFETLGALDRNYLASKLDIHSSGSPNKPSAKNKKQTQTTQTTGQGGTGYSVENRGASGSTSSAKRPPEVDPSIGSNLTAIRALQFISQLLPNPTSDMLYDLLPHPAIKHLLQLSFLPEILRELLRNDSVHEWTRQGDMYQVMIQLLQKLAESELSIEILAALGWEKKLSHGIDEFVWGTGELNLELSPTSSNDQASTESTSSQSIIARSPPLYEYFQKLVRQCNAFLSLVSQSGQSDDEETEQGTLQAQALCLAMIQAQDDLARAVEAWDRGTQSSSGGAVTATAAIASSSSRDPKGKGRDIDPNISMEQKYVTACEQLCFAHAVLSRDAPGGGLAYPSHALAQELADTAQSTRVPKKRLHLLKELSIMATSLPPGIWVRVDDVRNDAL